jgi:hypothetical protein
LTSKTMVYLRRTTLSTPGSNSAPDLQPNWPATLLPYLLEGIWPALALLPDRLDWTRAKSQHSIRNDTLQIISGTRNPKRTKDRLASPKIHPHLCAGASYSPDCICIVLRPPSGTQRGRDPQIGGKTRN